MGERRRRERFGRRSDLLGRRRRRVVARAGRHVAEMESKRRYRRRGHRRRGVGYGGWLLEAGHDARHDEHLSILPASDVQLHLVRAARLTSRRRRRRSESLRPQPEQQLHLHAACRAIGGYERGRLDRPLLVEHAPLLLLLQPRLHLHAQKLLLAQLPLQQLLLLPLALDQLGLLLFHLAQPAQLHLLLDHPLTLRLHRPLELAHLREHLRDDGPPGQLGLPLLLQLLQLLSLNVQLLS
mmetsp:Transcript_36982/g.90181  ORF Transcript_36982/g.90181 Transcript_36982/m.90181 type:complete len:239 (+) Transcript_36982:1963-2679(+)